MSSHVRVTTLLIYLSVLAVASEGAGHVPWFRPLLLQLVHDSDCMIAGRVVETSADMRGRGLVQFAQPTSWCERPLATPLLVHMETALPKDGWFVVFLRQEANAWKDIAPRGVIFPLERQDQQVVHRALRRLWKQVKGRTPTLPRQALFELLQAHGLHWRYQAALTLRATVSESSPLERHEQTRLRELLAAESDEALRHLLHSLIHASPAGKE